MRSRDDAGRGHHTGRGRPVLRPGPHLAAPLANRPPTASVLEQREQPPGLRIGGSGRIAVRARTTREQQAKPEHRPAGGPRGASPDRCRSARGTRPDPDSERTDARRGSRVRSPRRTPAHPPDRRSAPARRRTGSSRGSDPDARARSDRDVSRAAPDPAPAHQATAASNAAAATPPAGRGPAVGRRANPRSSRQSSITAGSS